MSEGTSSSSSAITTKSIAVFFSNRVYHEDFSKIADSILFFETEAIKRGHSVSFFASLDENSMEHLDHQSYFFLQKLRVPYANIHCGKAISTISADTTTASLPQQNDQQKTLYHNKQAFSLIEKYETRYAMEFNVIVHFDIHIALEDNMRLLLDRIDKIACLKITRINDNGMAFGDRSSMKMYCNVLRETDWTMLLDEKIVVEKLTWFTLEVICSPTAYGKMRERLCYCPKSYWKNLQYYNPFASIVFIITTAIIPERQEERKDDYIKSISNVIKFTSDLDVQIVIVESTFQRESYLDTFKVPVLYTNNNSIPTINKGVKEITDVFQVIRELNISDDKFIVKMTGRYQMDNPKTSFLEALRNKNANTKAIVRYGYFDKPHDIISKKHFSCITGLIGTRCDFVKRVKVPTVEKNECLEHVWADVINSMSDDEIKIILTLGIHCKVAGWNYIYVYN